METVIVYGQTNCPKCDSLKTFLRDLGIPFADRDMSEFRAYLDSNDAWPDDAGAPVLEILDPIGYEAPSLWTHKALFVKGVLQTDLIETIMSIKLVGVWE